MRNTRNYAYTYKDTLYFSYSAEFIELWWLAHNDVSCLQITQRLQRIRHVWRT